ncbi:MAG TPA: hypothetical protein DCL31_17550 [Clostridium sp.]|nr:hypothetical protein [Clostridium sp.]
MKKRSIFILILILISAAILISYGFLNNKSDTGVYVGESENWIVSFKVEKSQVKFSAIYKDASNYPESITIKHRNEFGCYSTGVIHYAKSQNKYMAIFPKIDTSKSLNYLGEIVEITVNDSTENVKLEKAAE